MEKRYGIIGKSLPHSYSKIIHEHLFNKKYDIIELNEKEFDVFIKHKSFSGVNITIPYKQKIIPYLDYIDEHAKKIGAVNTVLNKNGKLYGYNTDYLGFLDLIKVNNIQIKNKNVLILGHGGTSNTCKYVVNKLHAKRIDVVSREKIEGTISYEEAYKLNDVQIIINTTPVGMYPHNFESPIDISHFDHLETVIDVIYNPLRTKLLVDAKKRNIKYCGGLYMLISQAVYASMYFQNKQLDLSIVDEIYTDIRFSRENIVLIGMPGSGKSTIGPVLAKYYNCNYVDVDDLIEKQTGLFVKEFIDFKGIDEFRKYESNVIKDLSKKQYTVISTGGGIILNEQNIDNLKQNGIIIFVDRDLKYLKPTDNRPLTNDYEKLKKRYEERYGLYTKYADFIVKNNNDIEDTIKEIIKIFNDYEKNINN